MINKIQFKRINEAGRAPTTAQLAEGEIAINMKDKKVFTKDDTGKIISVGGGGSVPEPTIVTATSINAEPSQFIQMDMTGANGKTVTIPNGWLQGQFVMIGLTNWQIGQAASIRIGSNYTWDLPLLNPTNSDALVISGNEVVTLQVGAGNKVKIVQSQRNMPTV